MLRIIVFVTAVIFSQSAIARGLPLKCIPTNGVYYLKEAQEQPLLLLSHYFIFLDYDNKIASATATHEDGRVINYTENYLLEDSSIDEKKYHFKNSKADYIDGLFVDLSGPREDWNATFYRINAGTPSSLSRNIVDYKCDTFYG